MIYKCWKVPKRFYAVKYQIQLDRYNGQRMDLRQVSSTFFQFDFSFNFFRRIFACEMSHHITFTYAFTHSECETRQFLNFFWTVSVQSKHNIAICQSRHSSRHLLHDKKYERDTVRVCTFRVKFIFFYYTQLDMHFRLKQTCRTRLDYEMLNGFDRSGPRIFFNAFCTKHR